MVENLWVVEMVAMKGQQMDKISAYRRVSELVVVLVEKTVAEKEYWMVMY